MSKIETIIKVAVHACISWSWLLILCLGAGFMLGNVLVVALPPVYQSTAVVQLNAHAHASQTQIIQPVASYSTLVTSDPVLEPVIKQFPKLDRLTFITKELEVTPDTQSQSFQIQVTLSQARMAATIANALAQTLVTQQNAYIKSQYEKAIQLAGQHIADEQKEIDHLTQQYVATAPSNTATLTQLASQIDQQRNLQNTTIADQQALITEQALYNTPLSVVSSAVVATRASSVLGMIPFVPVMVVLFFIIGIIAMGVLEQSSGRIHTAALLQQKSSIPVLGALRWAAPLPLQQLCKARTPYAEDCRVMMADVLFHVQQAGARIVAFTCLRSQAGTSSVAAQLAALLAQSERRILLVDANLYHPSVHEQMGLPNATGLANMLEEARRVKASVAIGGGDQSSVDVIDRLPLEIYIRATNMSNLFILPAGLSTFSSVDLLSMSEMSQFLARAAKQVDLIILDCPALDHGDAHVLGTISDQTFVVVDARKDRSKQVLNMKQELASTGVKLTGLIVNKVGHWW